jgi:hypothetical protein
MGGTHDLHGIMLNPAARGLDVLVWLEVGPNQSSPCLMQSSYDQFLKVPPQMAFARYKATGVILR